MKPEDCNEAPPRPPPQWSHSPSTVTSSLLRLPVVSVLARAPRTLNKGGLPGRTHPTTLPTS